jgi:tripartite-type tricarboxylate transporter receptor subunit TctC
MLLEKLGICWCAIPVMLSLVAGEQSVVLGAEYPVRPIRLVVASAPGGNLDIVSRLIAQPLSESVGQTVVVDNRPGASSIIGTTIVARAAPDGYTILAAGQTLATNQSLVKRLTYDTARDFAPISLVSSAPLVLVVNPSLPVKTVKDLIALAKARPGSLNYSITFFGNSSHLTGALLANMAKVDIVPISYRGTASALTDLMAGRMQLAFVGMTGVLPFVSAGKLRALGVTGIKRSSVLPDVPTVSEAGVPGYEAALWTGWLAPAGTPRQIIDKLNSEIVRILNSPETRQRFAGMGVDPTPSSPEDMRTFLESETAKWANVVREAGIRAE